MARTRLRGFKVVEISSGGTIVVKTELRWCTRGRKLGRVFWQAEVVEDSGDGSGLIDAGDEAELAAAFLAGPEVLGEDVRE